MYKIELPKKVVKQLDKVPDKTYPAISTGIQKLKEISRPAGCKKLGDSLYRIRIGEWRVIYWIDDKSKTIVITKVDRRKERTYSRL